MSPEATIPKQQQDLPGSEQRMQPRPQDESPDYKACGKLESKVALITGADSGIGRAVAIAFAKEGADIACVYLSEHEDARATQRRVQELGRRCELISGDLSEPSFCREAAKRTVDAFGRIDVLVNHAGEQHDHDQLEDIPDEEMEHVFRTNILSMLWLTKAALPHIPDGGAIINTTSVNAYRGSDHLVDYSATKGAIVSFTRSLAKQMTKRGRNVRVNGVAPGPVWTPLIPATFPEQKVEGFGSEAPMGRPAQPYEMAPSYVFLASEADSGYVSGQVLHPNGGDMTES